MRFQLLFHNPFTNCSSCQTATARSLSTHYRHFDGFRRHTADRISTHVDIRLRLLHVNVQRRSRTPFETIVGRQRRQDDQAGRIDAGKCRRRRTDSREKVFVVKSSRRRRRSNLLGRTAAFHTVQSGLTQSSLESRRPFVFLKIKFNVQVLS